MGGGGGGGEVLFRRVTAGTRRYEKVERWRSSTLLLSEMVSPFGLTWAAWFHSFAGVIAVMGTSNNGFPGCYTVGFEHWGVSSGIRCAFKS